MTKKTRQRAAVVLLVAAGVAAAALYYAHRGSSAAQNGNVPALLELLPVDAGYLVYADIASFRASAFVTHLNVWASSASPDRDYQEFIRATGFDYARDLDRIVLAVRPVPGAGRTIALAEGRFDRAKLASYALRTGKMERQNGVEVYVVPNNSSAAKAFSFAFLDDHRIALAEGSSLAEVLGPHNGAGPDAAMREHIARVGGAAAYAVGRVGPVPDNLAVGDMRSDQFTNLARSLRWFSLAARPEGDRMRVALEGECDTAENAKQLAGTLDGLRLLGQTMLADPRTRQRIPLQTLTALEGLLKAAEVSRDDQSVRVRFELTTEMLDAFAQAAPARNQRR